MWFLPLCQLIFTAAQLIWTQHCIGLEKLPQFDLSYVKFSGVYLNFTFMSADLYSWSADLTSSLDWPWKTTPIWPIISEIPWCASQFMAFLSSCQLICTVAWLIWHHHWICHEKLPQFDLSYVKFLVCISIYYVIFIFMSADLYSCTADLTSPMDLPWKTTPIWTFIF